MNFLCPACKTPLPVTPAPVVVSCTQCGVEVDLTRVDTAPGQARLWPEVDLAGEQLGTFKLVSRAGSGGMGTVYLAEGLTGRCAVKVLSAAMAADPALRERFRREAQALRAVSHPNIVRIIDEGARDGFCWYAMEHVEGSDLRTRLQKGPLPRAEVEQLARDLLAALAAVHDAQLVHRDLKPANILLSPGGARLCDFGIARFDGATTLTESAALLGSLRYMAPEQRAGVTTASTDLYSLGLVLHEALGGGLPGEQELPSAGRLGRLIEALLQASPKKRPADARAAAKLLDRNRNAVALGAALTAPLVVALGVAAWLALPTPARQPLTATPAAVDAGAIALAAPVDAGALAQLSSADAGTPAVAAAVKRFPAVLPGQPDVGAGASRQAVRNTLDQARGDLIGCYEAALTRKPTLTGVVDVSFVLRRKLLKVKGRELPLLRPLVLAGGKKKETKEPIEADPAALKVEPELKVVGPKVAQPPQPPRMTGPAEVEVTSSTLGDAQLESCIVGVVMGWELPEPSSAEARVRVSWALQLTEQKVEAPAPAPPPKPVVAMKPAAAPRPTPVVTLGGKPEVGRGGDFSLVVKLADQARGPLLKCYDLALSRDAKVAGGIEVEFALKKALREGRTPPLLRPLVMGAGGPKSKKPSKAPVGEPPPAFVSPTELKVRTSTIADPDFEKCVLSVVSSWKLPEPDGVESATVAVSWAFELQAPPKRRSVKGMPDELQQIYARFKAPETTDEERARVIKWLDGVDELQPKGK